MTTQTQTQAVIETPTVRSPSFLLRALGGGLAATSIVLVNLGCGCSGDLIDSDDWSWGCLVEADVDGAPAQAEAEVDAQGTTIRLSPTAAEARSVTITMPGSTLDTLPMGELPLETDVEVVVCVGDAIGACVPMQNVVLEVVDLGDGTARASYSGTTLDTHEREVPAEGSFVFVRSSGI